MAAGRPDVRLDRSVASVLGENCPNPVAEPRRQLGGLLGAMVLHGVLLGTLSGTAAHFVRVSRSYWLGLCYCYIVADLPLFDGTLHKHRPRLLLPRLLCDSCRTNAANRHKPVLSPLRSGC